MTRQERRRFLAKILVGDDCWEWRAAKNRAGYGRMSIGGRAPRGRLVLAHRLAYEFFVGSIPDGAHVLHRCDNPGCVRPDHLWLGDAAANALDRDQKGRHRTNGYETRTHCPSGHPYDEANTYRHKGKRQCKECSRESTRRLRMKMMKMQSAGG